MYFGQRIHKTNSADSPERPFIKRSLKAILSLTLMPLISCVSNSAQAMPRISGDISSRLSAVKNVCNLEISNNGSAAKLVYHRAMELGLELNLDVPERVKISKPVMIFCDDKRTTIVTDRYVIRTIGYADLASGVQMLGSLDNSHRFYLTNAIFLSLEHLGGISSASISDSILTIVVSNGTYIIDVDKPNQPAKRIKY